MLTRTYPDLTGFDPNSIQWAIEHYGRIVAHAIDGDTADRIAKALDDCPECIEKEAALGEAERQLGRLVDECDDLLNELTFCTGTELGKRASKGIEAFRAALDRFR